MRGRFVGVSWAFSRNEGVEFTFREFLVRMGVITFETHCTLLKSSFACNDSGQLKLAGKTNSLEPF